jgi:hypothetical protein
MTLTPDRLCPYDFARFGWGSTVGGFALVVVYLLLCVGSPRGFASASNQR